MAELDEEMDEAGSLMPMAGSSKASTRLRQLAWLDLGGGFVLAILAFIVFGHDMVGVAFGLAGIFILQGLFVWALFQAFAHALDDLSAIREHLREGNKSTTPTAT